MDTTISGKIWLTLREAAAAVRKNPCTLRQYAAAGRIDPRCGRKMGRTWRFSASVIQNEGLILR